MATNIDSLISSYPQIGDKGKGRPDRTEQLITGAAPTPTPLLLTSRDPGQSATSSLQTALPNKKSCRTGE